MSKMKLAPLASAIRASRWPYALGTLLAPGLVFAGPNGGNVVAGQATISTPNGTTTVVDQSSQGSVIHWQGFDVGSDEYVIFNQPNASAAVLNKVVGGSASEIMGHLQSNGRVFIINPQGVLFGQGSQVNVGSLVASTMDIADSDFMSGRYVMNGAGPGSVVNQGRINAAEGGFVVLAGNKVSNGGAVTARLGDVALVSGNAVTLDLDGNGLVNFSVDEASLSAQAGVQNLGEIVAQGGRVVMAARTAHGLAQAAVNNSGRISASGVSEQGGDIYLVAEGGNVDSSGSLEASGGNGHDGGGVLIQSDADINLASSSKIDITGKNGGVARLIAKNALVTNAGSLIDGRAANHDTGKGGFVELSGHGRIALGGQTQLGKGGMLLLDPTNICIAAYGGTCTGSFDSTVLESDIEAALNYGTDVAIIASDNILVSSGLVGGAINSSTGSEDAELLLGIGYAGSGSTGGFSSPSFGTLSSTPGGFTNTNAATAYGGNITFQGTSGVNIKGLLTVRGGLDHGAITIGNVTAGHVDIRSQGLITLGNVVASVSDIVIQSDTAIRQTGTMTSNQGGIFLRFANSGTSSSVGNLVADNSQFNGICINSNGCDFEYDDSFSGYGQGAATLNLSGTRNWSASHVNLDNVDITGAAGTSLSIVTSNAAGNTGLIYLQNGMSADLPSLTLNTAGATKIYGAQIDADLLTITTGFLRLDEGAFLSGVTGNISQTQDQSEYGGHGIYNSSLSFSTKLDIAAVGEFGIQDTYINGDFDDDNNGDSPVNPSNLPLTHEVEISADDLTIYGFTTLNAGKLTVTAEAGDVFISGGMDLNFKQGTITAIAGEVDPPQALALVQTETPIPAQSGRVFLGEYRSGDGSPDTSTDAATLRFGTLNINAEQTVAEHATLGDADVAGVLTVNGEFHSTSSDFFGASATFTDNSAVVLGDSQTHYNYIDSSTFDFTGAVSMNTNHQVIISASRFNPPGQTPDPSAGSSVKITGSNLILNGVDVRASTIELNAKNNGSISFNGGSLAYNTAKLGVLDGSNQTTTASLDVQDVVMKGFGAGNTISFAAQDMLSVHGQQSSSLSGVHALFRVTSSEGYGDLSETATSLTGNLTIDSAGDFALDGYGGTLIRASDIAIKTGGFFESYSTRIEASNLTIQASGNNDARSAVFYYTSMDVNNQLKISGKEGLDFFGSLIDEGGNPLVNSASTINVQTDGYLNFSEVGFGGDTGLFNATGANSSGYSITADTIAFLFNEKVDFNGAANVDFRGETTVAAPDVRFHAGGSLGLDGTFRNFDTLLAESGVGAVAQGGDSFQIRSLSAYDLVLNGSITGGNVILRTGQNSGGSIRVSSELTLTADSLLAASGGNIYLDGATTLTIGGGAATAGGDPLLVSTIRAGEASGTLPLSTFPNASFVAGGEISLGELEFVEGGDYMFALGSHLSFDDLHFGERMFLNFTPSDQHAALDVNSFEYNISNANSGVTLAFGSSGYFGNITAASSELPIEGGDVNFVFATNGGTVTGADFVSTNGRVLVLTEFASGTDAAGIINQVNNLQVPKTTSQNGNDQGGDPAQATGDATNPEGPVEFQGGGDGEEGNEFECT